MIDKKNITEILKKVDIFSRFDKKTLSTIAKNMDVLSLKEDETLFKKGDKGSSMYIILEGNVKVHDEDYIFTTLGSKQYFGEYSLIDSTLRSTSVTALKESQILELSQVAFEEIAKEQKNIWKNMLSALIKRLREQNIFETKLTNRNVAVYKQKIEIESEKDNLTFQKKELENNNLNKFKLFTIIADNVMGELKNIKQISEDLEQNFNNLNPSELKKAIHSIHYFFKNTYEVLENLFIWSKTQLGSAFILFKKNDLIPIIEKIKNINKYTNPEKNIIFKHSYDEAIYGFFDEKIISLVISHLTVIIFDYLCQENEIQIIIGEKEDTIELNLLYRKSNISAEKLNQIFLKVGNNVKNTFESNYNKFKLGLIICKDFVLKNGGNIWAEEKVNKEIIIKLTVPKSL